MAYCDKYYYRYNEDYDEMYDWEIIGYPGWMLFGEDDYIPDEYLDERWKETDIPGYWVSDCERVWSEKKHRFVDGTPNVKSGYIDFSFKINGKRIHRTLHRLMAEAWIPNPYNFPLVRHLNDKPYDNSIDNLAWGTSLDNVHDCINNGNFKYFDEETLELAMKKRRKPVYGINLITGERKNFCSGSDAARWLGISQSCISAVARGENKSVCDWYFTYDEYELENFDYKKHKYVRMNPLVLGINLDTGEELIFKGITNFAKHISVSVSSISMVLHGKLKSVRGWIFEYVEDDIND